MEIIKYFIFKGVTLPVASICPLKTSQMIWIFVFKIGRKKTQSNKDFHRAHILLENKLDAGINTGFEDGLTSYGS